MVQPELALTRAPFTSVDADVLLLAIPAIDEDGLPEDLEGLRTALDAVAFTGKQNAFARVHAPEYTDRPLAVVGLGADPDLNAVRDAVGTAARLLTDVESVAVEVAGAPEGAWRAAAEGAALGAYVFDGYKTSAPTSRARRITIRTEADDAELGTVTAVADAMALVKDLVATPAEWQSPAELADAAVAAVRELDVDATVLDEAALAEGGYGGILGVGKGSDRPPRLVRLDYAPEGAARHVALVGKGITFDTGGLSLKPAASMVGMKEDMTGAATVLAVIRAAATLALPVRVTAWLCVADNMPSGRATRPGDVLRTLDGQTVEVTNTDAEGRLVLADGIAAASRERPDAIVDVATLTGAILVALGTRHTGVMGEPTTVESFLRAAERTGEPAWPLPLPEYMESDLDSPIADMQNAKVGDRAGGSLFAGLFLRRFVGRTGEGADAPRIPWLHLDIAGSGMSVSSGFGFTDKGPTGATVRALIDLLRAEGERR